MSSHHYVRENRGHSSDDVRSGYNRHTGTGLKSYSRKRSGGFGSSRVTWQKKELEIKRPDRICCHNCKKQHIIEDCKWSHCIFCW